VFFAGANPLRALAKSRVAAPQASRAFAAMPGHATVAEALAACARERTCNPWQERFALPLRSATVARDGAAQGGTQGGTWLARDLQNHALPLAPRFVAGDESWKLLALSGGHATGLFGEWDGDFLWPLAVWRNGALTTL